MPTIFESPRDLIGHDGETLATAEWLTVTQDRIQGFADVTGDHQWIHVDVERAKTGPFGTTIAHGYLTLSLVNIFLPQIIEVRNFKFAVNIGCDNLRFLAPVREGARIRGKGLLVKAETLRNAVQSVVRITIEIEGEAKPACVVDTISRYYLP
jgi:acyl dehydratase